MEFILNGSPYPTIIDEDTAFVGDNGIIQDKPIVYCIVYCQNCKYRASDGYGCYRTPHEFQVNPKGFCAGGEPKEGKEGVRYRVND